MSTVVTDLSAPFTRSGTTVTIPIDTLEAMRQVCVRVANLATDGRLRLTVEGETMRLGAVPNAPLRYMTLTQALPAGNGITALGQGRGRLYGFRPGSGTANGGLVAPGDVLPVYNLLNVAIKSGSTILAALVDGYWQYVLTICTNAVT